MSEPWTFRNLDLSDITPQRANTGLPVGKFVCVINDIEITPSRSGQMAVVYLEEIEGLGSCRDYITLHTYSTEENAKLAERIGKERFKALLECAGHPNSNNPGDINTCLGLVVGVITEQSDDYIGKDGNQRRGFVRPRRSGAYIQPSTLGWTGPAKVSTTYDPNRAPARARAKTPAPATADLDDDIPF